MPNISGWQRYIDELFISSGYISKAGIYGLGGKSVDYKRWASSNLNLSHDEIKVLVKSFIDPHNIVSNGIYLEGEKLVCLNTDSSLVIGGTSKYGCCIVKTRKCVIVVVYDEPITNTSNAQSLTLSLASFLGEHGF